MWLHLLRRFLVAALFSLGLLLLAGLISYTGAQWRWAKYSSNPITILDNVINQADTYVIDTALNRVTELEWGYTPEYKISNTLDSIRIRIPVYVQWLVFVTLVMAAMLIIYNGFLLVASPLSSTEIVTVKKRMMYIIAGIAMVSGFYFILRITLSILLNLASTT